MLNRRKLITGLISFVAAPAIVRASSLMPVKVMDSFDPQEAFNKLMNKYLENSSYGKFAEKLYYIKL